MKLARFHQEITPFKLSKGVSWLISYSFSGTIFVKSVIFQGNPKTINVLIEHHFQVLGISSPINTFSSDVPNPIGTLVSHKIPIKSSIFQGSPTEILRTSPVFLQAAGAEDVAGAVAGSASKTVRGSMSSSCDKMIVATGTNVEKCVCVCVYIHIYMYTCIYIYIYIYTC